MKKSLWHISILFFCLTSCKTTYFYSTLDSEDNQIRKSEEGYFYFENDTLSLSYNFKGSGLTINFSILNKLTDTLSLDWRQSALMLDDDIRTYGIVDDENEDNLLIPPYSTVNETPTVLSNFPFETYPDSTFSKSTLINNKLAEIDVLACVYDEITSPIYFTNYLTFNIMNKEIPPKSFTVKNSFYISEVVKTRNVSPLEMPDYTERQDLFYISKTKKSIFAKVMEGIGITIVLLGTIVLSVAGE